MELSKKSFIFKVAYGLEKKKDIPIKTSLCKLFWRIIFQILFWWPVFGISIIILSFVGIFVAKRVDFQSEDKYFINITRWPKYKGENIIPLSLIFIFVILCALLVISYGIFRGLEYAFTSMFTQIQTIRQEGEIDLNFLIWIGRWFLFLQFGGSIVLLFKLIKNSDMWKIFKKYCSALHQKVCPLVDIVEEERESHF